MILYCKNSEKNFYSLAAIMMMKKDYLPREDRGLGDREHLELSPSELKNGELFLKSWK